VQTRLTKEIIIQLFKDLNEELKKEKTTGELYLVGGAVMCLVFQSRPATYDVNAFFKPTSIIRDAAKAVAEKNNLTPDWINDGVKGFFSEQGSFQHFMQLSNLRILTAQPEYLLAMKCLSMRIGEEFSDLQDVRYLLRYLNISTFAKAKETVIKYYPESKFPAKTFYAIKEILEP
jgi:hypothetical protein